MGVFHKWGSSRVTSDNGNVQWTVAVVEDDEGVMHADHPALFVLKASDEELSQHEARLKDIEKQSGQCLYHQTQGA